MSFVKLIQDRNYALFLDESFDAGQIDERGRTALHLAAFFGREALARHLVIIQGADPNAQTPQGLSPIDYAIFQGHTHLAAFLISFRAWKTFRRSELELRRADVELVTAISKRDVRHLKTATFFIRSSIRFQKDVMQDLRLLEIVYKSSGLCQRLR